MSGRQSCEGAAWRDAAGVRNLESGVESGSVFICPGGVTMPSLKGGPRRVTEMLNKYDLTQPRKLPEQQELQGQGVWREVEGRLTVRGRVMACERLRALGCSWGAVGQSSAEASTSGFRFL